jgi:mannose-6-phosphate isomerase-like protein (cupin superfamily)
MIVRSLNDMVGGWMVGDFEPTCVKTRACEVACKHYQAGAAEAAHVHRIAIEVTLIVSGRVTMNGRTFSTGDIIVLEPGDMTDFRALENTTTVVVKMPSVAGDKYPVAGGVQ